MCIIYIIYCMRECIAMYIEVVLFKMYKYNTRIYIYIIHVYISLSRDNTIDRRETISVAVK